MTQLQKADNPEGQQLAPVTDMAGGILAVIERAVRDPSVDIDKMERLFALQERVMERQAKADFVTAKLAMRPDLPSIDLRGRIIIHDRNDKNKIIQETEFARFEDIHEAVMPILCRHGFDLTYKNGTAPDGKVRVTTILSHVAGHSEDTFFDLPHDSSGSKNAVQAIGSSTSYGKRYGTVSILNLRVSGEDDDGDRGGRPPTISDDQEMDITALMEDVGADKKRFLKYMGVASIADIPAADYDRAVASLNAKRGK